MKGFFNELLMWSEVWALLIPLAIVFIYKAESPIKPIIIYIFLALLLNTASDLISYFTNELPGWLQNNQILYNFHSIARTLLFSWYISTLKIKYTSLLATRIIPLYLIFFHNRSFMLLKVVFTVLNWQD